MTDWPLPDAARMDEIFESVKNWGRWGDDDEAGALNLITDDVRRTAAACVRHGRAVSCARDIPVDPAPDNPHPALHMMMRGGDDCLIPGIGFETTSDFVGIAVGPVAQETLDAMVEVTGGTSVTPKDASEAVAAALQRLGIGHSRKRIRQINVE